MQARCQDDEDKKKKRNSHFIFNLCKIIQMNLLKQKKLYIYISLLLFLYEFIGNFDCSFVCYSI